MRFGTVAAPPAGVPYFEGGPLIEIRRWNVNQAIREFVYCQAIAVVGVSRTGKKFGNLAYRELRKNGYDVMAVHPALETIEGDPCYASLRDLPRAPEGVLISLPPEKVEPVLREAAELGIRHVWLQRGAESPEMVRLAETLGLSMAHSACMLMYMQPVRSFHAFHRTLAGLFGRIEPTDYITPQMIAAGLAKKPLPQVAELLEENMARKTQIR